MLELDSLELDNLEFVTEPDISLESWGAGQGMTEVDASFSSCSCCISCCCCCS